MDKMTYKKLIGEYRALRALSYKLEAEKFHNKKDSRADRALGDRIYEIQKRLGFRPNINLSYIGKFLRDYSYLQTPHGLMLVLGSQNRMIDHPTPKLP